jgi:multiple sugar transport system permease protein
MKGFWQKIHILIMLLVGVVFISPLIIMVLTSFKKESEVMNPASVIPHELKTDNYQQILHNAAEAPIVNWLVNSVFVSCSVTLLVILISSMAAFAITRLRLRGGNFLFNMIVGSMMLPTQLFLIPLYMILSRMHLLDTPAALILPATAGGFGVFMLSQFMRSIPEAVEEAALLDGCSIWQVFWTVNLPLCGPAVATLAVFTFIGSWNDYVNPLVFMDSVRNYTLPVGIALFQSSYSTQYGLTLATSVLATVPLLLVFLGFQRQIIESMAASGLKD